VLVRSVEAESPAGKAGLRAGDVILSMGGTAIRETKDVRDALRSHDADTISVEVMRNRSRQTLKLEMARSDDRSGPAPARRVRSGQPL